MRECSSTETVPSESPTNTTCGRLHPLLTPILSIISLKATLVILLWNSKPCRHLVSSSYKASFPEIFHILLDRVPRLTFVSWAKATQVCWAPEMDLWTISGSSHRYYSYDRACMCGDIGPAYSHITRMEIILQYSIIKIVCGDNTAINVLKYQDMCGDSTAMFTHIRIVCGGNVPVTCIFQNHLLFQLRLTCCVPCSRFQSVPHSHSQRGWSQTETNTHPRRISQQNKTTSLDWGDVSISTWFWDQWRNSCCSAHSWSNF